VSLEPNPALVSKKQIFSYDPKYTASSKGKVLKLKRKIFLDTISPKRKLFKTKWLFNY